mmetsp:Transcript_15550/g.28261  ORF Transcript_15550/g.28261 Transcript_15550/m.28261 type:complete len:200 (+) Transcript_15550:441-1040(+)
MASHALHDTFSTDPFKILLETFVGTAEALLTATKGILFPVKSNKDFAHNLHHGLCTCNAQLDIITKTNISDVGGGEDKVNHERFFVAVNFYHEQVIHAKQFHLLTCPWSKRSTLLHSTSSNSKRTCFETQPLLGITATRRHQPQVSPLRFSIIPRDTHTDSIPKTTKSEWSCELFCARVRRTIRKFTTLPLGWILLHGL